MTRRGDKGQSCVDHSNNGGSDATPGSKESERESESESESERRFLMNAGEELVMAPMAVFHPVLWSW
jgi:hypothetical protein